MDFIVSKVAMSICALLVSSTLSGVLGDNVLFRNDNDLDSVLDELSTTLEMIAWSGCETEIVWTAPSLPGGESIDLRIANGIVTVRAGQRQAESNTACELDTWTWNGGGLNRSSLELLRANAPVVELRSGSDLHIQVRTIPFENQARTFLFVSTAV